MTYVIGVDVGGTFTDAFCNSETGQVASAKSPSTPPDFSGGIIASLDGLAAELGLDSTRKLLENTAFVMHGTTATINAIITGDTCKVGFITTKGHRDSIYIMGVTGRYADLPMKTFRTL